MSNKNDRRANAIVRLLEENERLATLVEEVRAMHKADDEHGCGFYGSPEWRQHYQSTRVLVDLPEQE